MATVARRSGQIPIDDEPMDIDIGDLPTDEEFAAAEAASASGAIELPRQSMGAGAPAPDSLLGLLQMWFTLVMVMYILVGIAVGAGFVYFGAGKAGWSALTHPQFYLIVAFWPIAIWQLIFNQY